MIKATTAKLCIDEIIVPDIFLGKIPSSSKITSRIDFYKKHRCFDRELIVDENNTLLDGYTVYLVCKMLGIEAIRGVRVKSNGMDANDYQKAALRTAGTTDTGELLLNGVMGLNGEAGECIDLVKKYYFQGHELNIEKLAKELGDVAWYLAVAAYAIGYDLSDILKMNVQKLKERYPDGFDADRSNHRVEED